MSTSSQLRTRSSRPASTTAALSRKEQRLADANRIRSAAMRAVLIGVNAGILPQHDRRAQRGA